MMDSKVELGVVNEKVYKVVNNAAISRKLLKDGYRIADIKPKRGHERETIFVFEVVPGFTEALEKYIEERRKVSAKEEE